MVLPFGMVYISAELSICLQLTNFPMNTVNRVRDVWALISALRLLPLVYRRLNHCAQDPAATRSIQQGCQVLVQSGVFDETPDGPTPCGDVGGDLTEFMHDVPQVNEH